MTNSLETKDGWLHFATIDADNDASSILVEAITDSMQNVVAVYITEGAVELHNVRDLIHALQCALAPYGSTEPERQPGPRAVHVHSFPCFEGKCPVDHESTGQDHENRSQ